MNKDDRARRILGQVLSMDRAQGVTLSDDSHYASPDMRLVAVPRKWNATITRAHVRAGTEDPWDLLSLHAEGELMLALHFRGLDLKIVRYKPGPWEDWFGTFEPTDRDVIGPQA